MHLIHIRAAPGIENIGERRRKCQRIHHGIALPNRGHSVFNLSVAAVVAGFADQEQDAQSVLWFVLEQLYRVVDRVQNFRSAVAGLQISQVVSDQCLVLREISGEIHLAIELHDRDAGGPECE